MSRFSKFNYEQFTKIFVLANKESNYLKNYMPKIVYEKIFKPNQPLPLGRWGNIKTDSKIDKSIIDKIHKEKAHTLSNLANYDHCGPCGNEFSPKDFDEKKIKK